MTYTTTTTASLNYFAVPGIPDEQPTPDELLLIVADAFNIPPHEIKEHQRYKNIKYARWCYWKILHSWGMSLNYIGKMSNHDHTTIMNALSKIDDDIREIEFVNRSWSKIKHHFKTDKNI